MQASKKCFVVIKIVPKHHFPEITWKNKWVKKNEFLRQNITHGILLKIIIKWVPVHHQVDNAFTKTPPDPGYIRLLNFFPSKSPPKELLSNRSCLVLPAPSKSHTLYDWARFINAENVLFFLLVI